MEDLVVGGPGHGHEDLVDAHLRDDPAQVLDPPHDRRPREAPPHLEAVIENAADGISVLGKHRHPLDQ